MGHWFILIRLFVLVLHAIADNNNNIIHNKTLNRFRITCTSQWITEIVFWLLIHVQSFDRSSLAAIGAHKNVFSVLTTYVAELNSHQSLMSLLLSEIKAKHSNTVDSFVFSQSIRVWISTKHSKHRFDLVMPLHCCKNLYKKLVPFIYLLLLLLATRLLICLNTKTNEICTFRLSY